MGIYIPGALVIGKRCGSGGNAGGADLSDIDFTAAMLDSRVKYQRAGDVAYLAPDGAIKFAAAGVWPLEYRDGVAAGRHEPEPAATNVLTYSRQITGNSTALYKITYAENSGPGLDGEQAALQVTAGVPSYVRFTNIAASAGETLTLSVFYHRSDPAIIYNDISDTAIVTLNARNFTYTVTPTASSSGAVDIFGDWARVRTTLNISKTANYYADVFRLKSEPSLTTLIDFVQIEKSGVATSPILSAGAETTRAAATAVIKNPGGIATALRLHYSDGAHIDIEAAGGDFAIPPATLPWAARYITRAEYFKL